MKNLKWIALAALIVVLVAGATGAAAYSVGKQAGVTEGLAARNNFFQARAGGAGAQGGQGGAAGSAAQGNGARGGQGNGNFAAGQVKSISGNDLEISTATDVTKVKLTDKTQIQKNVSGTPSDITTGERVVVQGTKGSDGAIEANSIQIGGGRLGGPGGGQGQGGQ
jgi:predicted acylesterase/phospholipase RssA